MKISLTPKTTEFFVLFAHSGENALEVARLKATDGSFNIPLPDGADPTEHRSVLIWCKQFSHLFAVAPLGAI